MVYVKINYSVNQPVIKITYDETPIYIKTTEEPIYVKVLYSGVEGNKFLYATARNQTGVTMPKGSVVYISGATGNKALLTLADADMEVSSSKTFGILPVAIPNNEVGVVITAGEITNLDTSMFTEGDLLWLSTTAGGMVNTPPAEPAHAVFLGYVIRSHPNFGVIEAKIINGFELTELHGVLINGEVNNQVLKYDGSTSLWKNKSVVDTSSVPSTATSSGMAGDIKADSNYLYICTATNTWKRVALSSW